MYHSFKYITYSGGNRSYIAHHKIKIISHKLRKRSSRAHTHNIHLIRPQNRGDNAVKNGRIDLAQGSPYVVYIALEHLCKHFVLLQLSRHLYKLYRGKAVAYNILHGSLKLRISVITQTVGKAHHC